MSPDAWLRDGEEIKRRNFACIQAECDLSRFGPDAALAARLLYAAGEADWADRLIFGGGPLAAGRRALRAGGSVICDSRMVEAGILRGRLPAGCGLFCAVDSAESALLARRDRVTRSAAAMDALRDRLEGAVVAVGAAATALFRLLEIMAAPGGPRPAVIFAFPVGFTGAAEAKEALIAAAAALEASPAAAPFAFATAPGRGGGAPLAVAAVNALLLEDPPL